MSECSVGVSACSLRTTDHRYPQTACSPPKCIKPHQTVRHTRASPHQTQTNHIQHYNTPKHIVTLKRRDTTQTHRAPEQITSKHIVTFFFPKPNLLRPPPPGVLLPSHIRMHLLVLKDGSLQAQAASPPRYVVRVSHSLQKTCYYPKDMLFTPPDNHLLDLEFTTWNSATPAWV